MVLSLDAMAASITWGEVFLSSFVLFVGCVHLRFAEDVVNLDVLILSGALPNLPFLPDNKFAGRLVRLTIPGPNLNMVVGR